VLLPVEATVVSKAQVNGCCCHFGHIAPTNHSLTDRNDDRARPAAPDSTAPDAIYRRQISPPLPGRRRYVVGQITSLSDATSAATVCRDAIAAAERRNAYN